MPLEEAQSHQSEGIKRVKQRLSGFETEAGRRKASERDREREKGGERGGDMRRRGRK